MHPSDEPRLDAARLQALLFGRAMAEQLFTQALGPATPHRPAAMVVRLDDLVAMCAGAFAMGRDMATLTAPSIPVGEATELPVETIVPGAMH